MEQSSQQPPQQFSQQPSRPQVVFHAVLFLAALVIVLLGLSLAAKYIAPLMLTIFFTVVLMIPLRWLKKRGVSDLFSVGLVSLLVFSCGLGIVVVIASSGATFARKLPEYQHKLATYSKAFDSQINFLIDAFEEQSHFWAEKMTHTVSHSLSGTAENSSEIPAEKNDANEMQKNIPDAQDDLLEMFFPLLNLEQGRNFDEPRTPEFSFITESEKTFAEKNTDAKLIDAKSIEEKNIDEKNDVSRSRFSIAATLSATAFSVAQHLFKGVVDVANVGFMVMVLVIFALFEGMRFPAKVEAAFGRMSITSQHLEKIGRTIVHYTVIKTVISVVTGAAVTLVLLVLGVEYALLWGLFACFFNFIPNFGPIIASAPPVLLALVDGGATQAFWCVIGLTLVHSISGYIVEPRFMGDGLGISPLVVLLSVFIWGWFFGMTGMFLSAPLTVAMKIICDAYDETRWIAILLEDKPRETRVE